MIVPKGNVVLNFTELLLFGKPNTGDQVSIFDGQTPLENNRIGDLIGSEARTEWFVGSGNKLTVVFYASDDNVPQKTYRFSAKYYMKEDGEYYFLYSKCSTRFLYNRAVFNEN